jgi:hypothetical protein
MLDRWENAKANQILIWRNDSNDNGLIPKDASSDLGTCDHIWSFSATGVFSPHIQRVTASTTRS